MNSSDDAGLDAALSGLWRDLGAYVDSVDWRAAALRAASTPPEVAGLRRLQRAGLAVKALFEVPLFAAPAMVRGSSTIRLDAEVALRCGLLPTVVVKSSLRSTDAASDGSTTAHLHATPDLDVAEPVSDLIVVVEGEEFHMHRPPSRDDWELSVTIGDDAELFLVEVERG